MGRFSPRPPDQNRYRIPNIQPEQFDFEPGHAVVGVQEFRSSGVQEFRSSGVQEFRSSGVQGV
jgi:hypothetical protein